MKTDYSAPGKLRSIFYIIFRILTGLLLVAMSAIPIVIIFAEFRRFGKLLEFMHELGDFFGNQVSAWSLVSFLSCVPLLGIYLITEPIVRRLRLRYHSED